MKKAARAARTASRESLVESHILELEALGWHVIRLRAHPSGEDPPLWHVSITRDDGPVTMNVEDAALDAALAELLRYAKADTRERQPSRAPARAR